MKLEITTLSNCEPGTIYFIPRVIRCKKCNEILEPAEGWKCKSCHTQWSINDYVAYFGVIKEIEEPFVLRKLCDDCYNGDLKWQIHHRISKHFAIYIKSQHTVRYSDHLLDIIPPKLGNF